jgi:hypothetical protein
MLQEASFSLAEAKFATGDFNHAVIQNVNKGTQKFLESESSQYVFLRNTTVKGKLCFHDYSHTRR